MAGAKFQVIGMKEVNKFLTETQKTLKHSSRFFARSAVIGYQDVMRHFQNESGPKGKWKSLKLITIARRRKGPKKGRGVRILQDKGMLRNSISFSYDSKEAKVGTNKRYAAVHNYGYKHIRKRQYLWLSKDAKGKIEKVMTDILQRL